MEKNKLLNYGIVVLALLLGMVFAVGMALRSFGGYGPPEPKSLASGALENIQEQQRLSAFAATYIVSVTREEIGEPEPSGQSASNALIIEGLVQYEIDLEELTRENIRWAPRSNKLVIKLPPIKLTAPQIDLNKIRQYNDDGLLRLVANAEKKLTKETSEKAQAELLLQAQAEMPMKLARDAHRGAIQQLFELPLRAAGLSARVEAFYPSEEESEAAKDWNAASPIKSPAAAH